MKSLARQALSALRRLSSQDVRRRFRRIDSLAAEISKTESLETRALLAAGAYDPSFAFTGQTTGTFDRGGSKNDAGSAVAIQPDGKILVAGTVAISSSGDRDFGVVRYNSNGLLDTTFGTSGKKTIAFDLGGDREDIATGIAIQSNGKIVVTGFARANSSGRYDFAIARLNANGTLDTTFSGDGKQTVSFGGSAQANGVAIQSDGRIVVAGSKVISDGDHDMAIARLTTSGTLDTTFSGDGLATVAFDLGGSGRNIDKANAVAIQSDGKIVLAGSAQRTGDDVDFAVARLNTNGSLDNGFDGDGKRIVAFDRGGTKADIARAVTITSGKIIVAGDAAYSNTGDTDFAVARINSNGSLDTTFDSDGKQTISFDRGGDKRDVATSVRVQSNGRIVLAGHVRTGASDRDLAIARLNSNGSLDSSFNGNGKKTSGLSRDDIGTGLAIQSNGRLVTVGSGTSVLGDLDFQISRFMDV